MEPIYRIPRDTIVNAQSDVLPLAEANWGMATFEVELLRAMCPGTGIIVGVIDTGVDRNHPDLKDQVIAADDFSGSGHAGDRNGHGTHCSGTIGSINGSIGVAPGCKLVHGKGLNDSGSGGGRGIANAMRYCVAKGAKILSMSLGSSGLDPSIDEAGKELTAAGILICCAAGNSGGNTPAIDFPGRLPWAISVAALQQNLTPASFSSAGEGIETSAPGTNIWSCRSGGGYKQMSGTSMATPFCAGVLALYESCRKLKGKTPSTTADIHRILQSRAMDIGTPGVDRRSGSGAVWPRLLLNELVDAPPPVAA